MKALRALIEEKKELEFVFFDIFDTILLRTVHPEYTKMIWAKRLSVQFAGLLTANEIYEIRHQIEIQVCNRNEAEGGDKEFKYEQMALQLYQLFQTKQLVGQLTSEQFCKLCLDIETDVELAVQYVDETWKENVKFIKEMTKLKIICVSDFYLPVQTIREFFEFHGILSYVDEIIVSSEYLVTKRSGRLFDLLLNTRHFDPQKILMVGDNEVSDYQMPISKNMHAHLINRNTERDFYERFLQDNQFNDYSVINRELASIGEGGSKKSPFHNIIFSLFYFTKKLHETLVGKSVRNVFFLSREGEYLKKLFDIYQQQVGVSKEQKVNSHYLKVSRKATFLPSLKELEHEQFDTLFRQYRKISAFDFLSSLNVGKEFMESLAIEININLQEKQDDFPTSPIFEKLMDSESFQNYYNQKRTSQNEWFRKHVSDFDVNVEQEGLHIVDVGWKGTIQDNIWNIYKGEVEVTGYYVGLVANGDLKTGNEKFGLLFSCFPQESPYFGVFNENRAIYEILLGASHGSAESYVLERDGQVSVETKQNDKEGEIFSKVVSPAQKEMLETFSKLCDLYCKRAVDIEGNLLQFSNIHADMMLNPRRKEIDFFDKLYHYENFGVFQFTEFLTKKKQKGLFTIVHNVNRLVRNPHVFFAESFWGPITLRDNGLTFLIPLYSWYKKRKYFKNHPIVTNANIKTEEHKAIRSLEHMIKDRDEAIANMTKMIDDRDAAIKSMTAMIDERDRLIKELYGSIEERDKGK